MRKVELSTPTSILRPPTIADASAIAAACQDAEIHRWVPVPVPYGLEDAHAFVTDISGAGWETGASCTWAIQCDGALAGMVSLDRIVAGQATIGFWMAPKQRGRGILTEALRSVIEFGFAPAPDGLGLVRIEWHAYLGNSASARVARRVGFRFEGTLRLGGLGRQKREDEWIAGLLASDPCTPSEWPVI